MRAVYRVRDRHAFPALLSLFLAALLSAPLESLILPPHQLPAERGELIHITVRVAAFVWLFAVTGLAWRSWLARRPGLVPIGTSSEAKPAAEKPGADGQLPGA